MPRGGISSSSRRTIQSPLVLVWAASLLLLLTYSLWSCGSFSSTYQSPASSHLAPSEAPAAAATGVHVEQQQRASLESRIKDVSASAGYLSCKQATGNGSSSSSSNDDSVPTAADVLDTFERQWGPESCVVLRNACMDEGTFVTFGNVPYLPLQQKQPWLQFKLHSNHLDFRGFGDVAGIIRYPDPIIRPGGLYEESTDLQQSHLTFSSCVRPVVVYLNFAFAFGDWWLRSMPTFMHAMAAGAWDTRYSIVLATGGQRLERWQKLVLQTLTDHPVVTLSAASSRTAAVAAASAASGADVPYSIQAAAAAAVTPDVTGLHKQQPQKQQPKQKRMLLQQAAAAVTPAGRCFELLTVCSISDARTFPSQQATAHDDVVSSNSSSSSSEGHVPQETWAGAQHVRQYYMQRYGQQYSYLPRQYKRLQEPKAFRVVFAVRGAVAGGASRGAKQEKHTGSSSGNGVSNPSEAELASSTRQVLNIQQLLQWCNTWVPAASAVYKELQGIDANSEAVKAATAAAGGNAGNGVKGRYRRAVCVAHEFGRHGQLDIPARAGSTTTDSSSSSSGSSGKSDGWWGRAAAKLRRLASTQETQQQQQQQSTKQQQQQSWPGGDPELDPRALMTDLAVLENADVVVGLHGAQLYNALFMPAHKSLVEVRPYGFWGGWPKTYFYDPLVKVDRDQGILWWGIDTVSANNSRPGRWETQGVGVQGTYARDRHTRIEPAALEMVFRRIIWAQENPDAYKELKYAGLTHITDTLQPAEQFHAAVAKAEAASKRRQAEQRLQRPEIAAAVQAAKAAAG